MFRIAQEALRNVERHGPASTVAVTADFDDDEVELSVVDDGPGFEWPASSAELLRRGKLGIVGMQERADLVGGQLSIRSVPGGGTRVAVRV